jgi:transcriptional regulator with PAS, ATPase and Fis domain
MSESHLDTNLTARVVRHETLDRQVLYEDNQPMIDKPVGPAGNLPATFSPMVRAVIDSVTEGVVIFDQQGRLLYANTSARRVIDGQNGDVRNRLQSLGARFAPLKNGTQNLGEAAILPPTGALTLAERERQAIADTLQDTSGKLAETARRLGISRTTLWRRLKSYGMDGFRASP